MSDPARTGAYTSQSAEVRVNRGSAWISVAPRSLACRAKRNAIGWFSAMFDPITTMQSLFARSHCGVLAAPRPNVAPKLGTEELCQTLAWFSIHTIPSPPPSSFLMR
jgi:hypothetical protein